MAAHSYWWIYNGASERGDMCLFLNIATIAARWGVQEL